MTRIETIIMLARRLDRPYREIGDAVGVSPQAAHQAVRRHAPDLAAQRAQRTRKKGRCRHCGVRIPGRRKYCSLKHYWIARRDESSYRARAYRLRRHEGMTWRAVAAELAMRSETYAITEARLYAKSRGMPWPIKGERKR